MVSSVPACRTTVVQSMKLGIDVNRHKVCQRASSLRPGSTSSDQDILSIFLLTHYVVPYSAFFFLLFSPSNARLPGVIVVMELLGSFSTFFAYISALVSLLAVGY